MAWRLWFEARPLPVSGLPIRVSFRVLEPATFGGTVLLPAESANWSASKLRAVLLHEAAHVRNWDFYVQLMARLHCALFWFNPAAWWLKNRLADLAERTSDIAAIEGLEGDRRSYTDILRETARPIQVADRIKQILGESVQPPRLGWRDGLTLATLLLPLIVLVAGGRL
jgi:beta-lactamase regulating signal transducer with metallopeptidase domain